MVHWPTAGVHKLGLYLVGTPVLFRVEESSFEKKSGLSSRRMLCFESIIVVFKGYSSYFENYRKYKYLFIYYTLEFDIIWKREKRENN